MNHLSLMKNKSFRNRQKSSSMNMNTNSINLNIDKNLEKEFFTKTLIKIFG